jgi:hypothetical protein
MDREVEEFIQYYANLEQPLGNTILAPGSIPRPPAHCPWERQEGPFKPMFIWAFVTKAHWL